MKDIEAVLRNSEFSKDLPLYREIKKKVDPELSSLFFKIQY